MLKEFQEHIDKKFPDLKSGQLLLACSGGVDSMVLADLLLQNKHDFALAHCNYKLRGEDSDADEALVLKWGKQNNTLVFTKTIDLSGSDGSIQLKAREARYQWFVDLVENEGFEYILTAHHADDAIETFFINLLRGTGLGGLTGIPEQNQNIVRPLLPFSKAQILQYAIARKVIWREDKSNTEDTYVRNKIRLEVLPQLREINPDFFGNFKKTQHFLGQSAQLLVAYASMLRSKLFNIHGNEIHIRISEVLRLQPLEGHLHLLFHTHGFTQWDDMADLLNAQSGKEIQSKSHRIIKDRNILILTPLASCDGKEYPIGEEDTMWKGPIKLKMERVAAIGKTSEEVIYVDKETLNYPLKLRKWKIGDYFYPFGMRGKKKLSKYFKDEKFSTIEKERQWLLCSNNDIIWVVGHRPDDRFKVTETTQTILKLTWIV